jgi:hypothetical protein
VRPARRRRRGFRQHRHVAQQFGIAGGLLFAPVVLVQVGRRRQPQYSDGRARTAHVLQLLDQRLDGRKAGAAGQQDHGLGGVLAQEEAAEGAFHAQDVALLHRAKDVVGEQAARHVAQVQFDGRRAAQLVWRIGHAVAAPRAVAQDELDILPGAVLQVLVGRQLQAQHRHVGCGPLMAITRVGIFSTGNSPAPGTLRACTVQSLCGVAQQVRIRPAASSAADRRLALVGAVLHRPEQAALAGAAGAVAAAIGQADALADGGGSMASSRSTVKTAARGLQRDGETHGWRPG